MYQDEVHFQVTTSVTRKWVLKGSAPRVKSHPSRKSVAYSGFVIPQTGELLANKPNWFNFETVIESIRQFLANRPLADGQKYIMVLDNAPWHKKAIRLIQTEKKPEYEDIRAKIEFLSLPPYAPDLNPIEQCWRITRREKTHNRYFNGKEAIEKELDDYFAGLRAPNEKIRRLCSFKHDY